VSITITNKISGTSTTSTGSFNTIAINITAGKLYLMALGAGAAASNTATINSITAANGITWTIVGTVCEMDAGINDRLYLYKGYCTGAVSGASWTVNCSTNSGQEFVYVIDEVSDTSGAIIQNAKSQNDNSSPTSVTLSAFDNAANITYMAGGVEYNSNNTFVPESGYTLLGNVSAHNGTDYIRVGTAYKSAQDTSPSFTWNSTNPNDRACAIACEIQSLIFTTGAILSKTTDIGALTSNLNLIGVNLIKARAVGSSSVSIPMAGLAKGTAKNTGTLNAQISGAMASIARDTGGATLTFTLSGDELAKAISQGNLSDLDYVSGVLPSQTNDQGAISALADHLSGLQKGSSKDTGATSESLSARGNLAPGKTSMIGLSGVTITDKSGAMRGKTSTAGAASESKTTSGSLQSSAADVLTVTKNKAYITGEQKGSGKTTGSYPAESEPLSGQESASAKTTGAASETKALTGLDAAKTSDVGQLDEQKNIAGSSLSKALDTASATETENASGTQIGVTKDTASASETLATSGALLSKTTDTGAGVRADVLSGSMAGKTTDSAGFGLSFTISGQSLAKALDTGATQPRIRSLAGLAAGKTTDAANAQIIPVPLSGLASAKALDNAGKSTLVNVSGVNAAIDRITGSLTVTYPQVSLSAHSLISSTNGGILTLTLPLSGHELASAIDSGALTVGEINANAWRKYRLTVRRRIYH
jgi:hypothetical protein